MGNSLGGGVAWRLAVERPDLASRVADSRFLTHDSVGHVPMEVLPKASAADAAAFLSET